MKIKHPPFKLLFVATAIAAFAAIPAQATLITFSNSASLNDFVQTGPGGGSMTWSSNTGVGGVSGVLAPSNSDKTIIYNTDFNWTLATTPLVTSVFIQYQGVNSGQTNQYAQIGFLESNTISFNGNAGQDYVSVRLANNGGTQLRLQGQSSSNGTTTTLGEVNFNISGNITVGNWYLLTGTFTRGLSNQVAFSATLVDYGAQGTTPAMSAIASTSGTMTVASSFFTDTEVYNGFRSTISTSQGYLDNFTAVPEPEVVGVLAAASLAVLTALRRRRAA